MERLVAPYGLVAKAGIWYLVYARQEVITVRRVSNLISVSLTDQSFERPADFDLAAFYDTICHELLMKVLFPRGGGEDVRRMVTQWLETWSSDKPPCCHRHGIPQGPAASDFLAECFLLPVDEILSKNCRYARYGDDIRIFASGPSEIRKAAVWLEVLCRNRGLIPQVKKHLFQ